MSAAASKPTMQCVFKDVSTFVRLVNVSKALMDQFMLTITPSAITIRGMDPSHVALIDAEVPREAFESYECKEAFSIGINSDLIANVLKSLKGDKQTVKLDVSREYMVIRINTRQFKLRLIEASLTNTPVPKVPVDASITMPDTKFKEMITSIALMANMAMITVTKSGCTVHAKDDSGSIDIKLGDTADEDFGNCTYANMADAAITGTYSTEYLVQIAPSFNDGVLLEFAENTPLKITSLDGCTRYYLAPRVDQ